MSPAKGKWSDHGTAVVYAHDIAWGGWGRAICTPDGPVQTSWVRIGSGWDWYKLRLQLEGPVAMELLDALACRAPSSPPVLVSAEKPPPVYRGRGNQAATGYGMGRIIGPLMVWACRPENDELAYPLAIDPKDWRAFWGLKGNRAKVKRAAVALVRHYGWGRHLEGHGDDPDGRLGDVAEAVLQGVGLARRKELWLNGPARLRL